MKIRKTPSKKLAPLPSQLRDVIGKLETDSEDQIPAHIEKLKDWTFPRGDLFHWAHALNRFDAILQRVCLEYELDHIQAQNFDPGTKRLLIAIANLSKTLFENCTNRNIYSSYEHMNSLLNTTDIDVLEAVLRFLLRPAQRVNNPRAIRPSFTAPQDKITELARGWAFHKDLVELSRDDLTVMEEMTTLKLQFYRTRSFNDTSGDGQLEGINIVTAQMASETEKSDIDIFNDLVKQHNIPSDYHFELANRIRVSRHIADPKVRRQLLIIQFLSIAIMAHTVSETTAQNKVFVYEPHLVNQLAELMHPEKMVSYDIQTYALYALDAVARHRSKLSEILTAFNASANHAFPQEFLDALFTFLSYLLQTQSGAQMLMSAGIIPTLVNIVENHQSVHIRNVTKVVGLLDTIVNSYTTSFSAFCNAGGLDTLLSRITVEVENCIRSANSMEGVISSGVVVASEGTNATTTATTAVPYERIACVKTMLKFLIRMMESSGTDEGLRNLIDSSLPQSLKLIVENPKVFGNSVFALATNVFTTFIHNEPTSLSILQEAKLPQSFLRAIATYEGPNNEVMVSAIHAFGAVCLNSTGLEMFNEVKPLPHFFELLTSEDYLRNPADIDGSTLLGATVDELIRHHPSLKKDIFECCSNMLKKLQKMGTEDVSKATESQRGLQLSKRTNAASNMDVEMTVGSPDARSEMSPTSPAATEEKPPDNLLISFIDLIARFLEGLFQNQSNIKDFDKEGCSKMLLSIYSLPLLPADFSTSIACDSLAYLFRMIGEVSPIPTVLAIAEKVKESIKFIIDDNRIRKESMVAEFIDVQEGETEKIERGNKLFRQLVEMFGYVGLLSNICTSTVLAHGKNGLSLVSEFISQDESDNIILQLGKLHRTMVWETILLRESVPKSWYSFKLPKKNASGATENPLGISGFASASREGAERSTGSEVAGPTNEPVSENKKESAEDEPTPDANDPRVINVKHFKTFLSETSPALLPIFQGLIKVSVSRRTMDTMQKAQAFKLAEYISQVLIDNISWSSIAAKDAPPCKYDYLATMFSMMPMIILDDRSTPSLHTPLAVTFDRKGGTELLCQYMDQIWFSAEEIEAIPHEQRSKEQESLISRMDASLELLLTVMLHMGSAKLLHDSPYTASITSRQKDRNAPDYFDPYEWIVSLQLKLSSIKDHLDSPYLDRFPKSVVRTYLKVIAQMMKGEGEVNTRSENNNPTPFPRSLPSPFTIVRTPVVPDQNGVQTLVDMGFLRSAAEHAMIRCNNQISRAVDYLFSHPAQMLGNMEYSAAGTTNAQTQDAARRNISGGQSINDGQGEAANTSTNDEAGPSGQDHDNSDSDDEEDDDADDADEADSDDDDDDEEEEEEDDDDEEDDSDEDDNDGQDDGTHGMDNADASRTTVTPRLGPSTAMEEDGGESTYSDKGKQKATAASANLQQLNDIRKALSEKIPSLVIGLTEKRDDIVFDVRDLLVVLFKDDTDNYNSKRILGLLVESIDNARKQSQPPYTVLCTQLQLMALLLREQSVQPVIAETASRMSFLFEMLDSEKSLSDPDAPLPAWLATVFLVVEAFISQTDEPKSVKLVSTKHVGTAATEKTDSTGVGNDNAVESSSDSAPAITAEQRSKLLRCCVTLLNKSDMSRDNIYAVLRIVVRLTKYHAAALEFIAHGGLPLLFLKPRTSLEGFQGQQAFIILILRHVIEDKAVLEEHMEDMITTWFTIPRPRNMDINAFIRNNAHIALHEPSTFLEVSGRICRLARPDEIDFNRQIKLVNKQESDEDASMAESGEYSGNEKGDAGHAGLEHRAKSGNSDIVIQHLLTELLAVRGECSIASSEGREMDAEEKKKGENIKYAYTGFLLQCLVELVSSYASCKYDIYLFSRRRNSKDGNAHRPRHSVLNMLVNDLLPYNAINPTEEVSRKQQGLSMWTASVLVAMCYDTSSKGEDNTANKNELNLVRKYVLEGIIRSLKDAIASTDLVAVKYSKYLALADLCHRILNARPNPGALAQRTKEDTSVNIAKIMLEKNFVAVLTSAISDVDVNYPHSKTVLNSMLRPLEQLTKLAIKIERISEQAREDKKHEELPSFVPTDASAEPEEAPDLYRNSSLGMFGGGALEEDDMEEGTSEEEEEGMSYDEDEFDEDTGSDLSDMSEEGGMDDVDQEMDVMMHRHHYGSDMDEDEDESEEHDHEHDEEDEEEQSDISDQSLDSGESEDIDDEDDGREMTWHIEDIEDEDGPVLHLRTEVTIDSDEEQSLRHGHGSRRGHAPYDEGQEDDLDTIDQSDFDEGEEGDAFEDEIADAELNDGVLIDGEDLDNPFLTDDLEAEGVILDDNDVWHRSRSLGPFGFRRTGRLSHNRRGFVEGDMPARFDALMMNTGTRERMPIIDSGSYQIIGRSFGNQGAAGSSHTRDDITTHPLLTSAPETSITRTVDHAPSRSRLRHHGIGSLQAFEDIIGGNAVRILENLLSEEPEGLSDEPFRAELQAAPGVMPGLDFDRITSLNAGATQRAQPEQNDQSKEIMSVLHDFQPMSTAERWHQEARMMYGYTSGDKAVKLVNSLLNILIPIAVEEEKKRKEEEARKAEEQRRKEEEEERRRQEEERKRKEEEEQQRAAEATQVSESDGQAGPSQVSEEPESQQERTTITINGEQVDISDTGIDVEFLEALPDELREEVINQHYLERRVSSQTAEDDSISPEFLNALPDDIREEVLHQEAMERVRRERQRQGNNAQDTQTSAPATLPSSNLLAPLDAIVRDFGGLITGRDFRSRLLPGVGRNVGADGSAIASSSKKPGGHRDTIQLVDRAQLATLARLLFVPQSISKTLLNRLLLNLCENSKTRGDLLSLLICILQDGSADLAAVDRSFAQLSLHPKGAGKGAVKPKTTVPTTPLTENVPNLITQRCLEVLYHVVSSNEQSLTYFLTENDCLAGLKRQNSKKGKGKGKDKDKLAVSSKYPLLVLMSLLDRSVFVENSNLMEELMNLLATMCRPFPLLVKKYVEKMETRQIQQQQDQAPRPEDQPVTEGAEDQSQTKAAAAVKEQEKPIPKPPAIPDHYLKMVVHVLTSGECSSRTFQYTLGALSHLSALDGAQQTITNELMAAAKQSGKQIIQDLEELLQVLQNMMSGTEIQGSALSQFSAATSDQAKLLRVLKTIDYLYSRKKSASNERSEEAAKDEKRVLQIYEELDFLKLWKMLGHCLAVIHEKEELINVATVLLPLIESFMVVSKYAAGKGHVQRSSSLGPVSPSVEQPAATEQADDFFFAFTEDHKKILNIMVRNNPSLMSGSFSLLVRNPKMLEFDNKRNYFVQQLHKRSEPREHYPTLQLNVRRQYVFEDSYHQLQGRTGNEIKYGKLNVRFYNEEGMDAGGVSREWFSVLARQMFDPNYALFITSAADKLTYQPNHASCVNPDHLSFFKFVGRVIGKAIYDGRLLDAYFTRSFYKHILGRPVDYRDVEAIDPEYYKSLVWMLENDITDVIDLTFSIETDDFGTTKTIDLKPGGRDIPVTEANKHEYVTLVTEQKLTNAIKDQINAFLQGFHDIIPASLIKIFNEQELELLISGLPDIDIDDWKNNTVYEGGYSASSPQIQWFWRAVRSFDQEERAKLLQFATGTSKVPLEGFAHLQGSSGVQKFQIHKDFGGDNRLPSAHTCFNQVDLPVYNSYESLRANLFKAMSECSTGFGFV
ncbi:hypothetical protein EC973_001277 [Apophysomyces ossiformis]|uniref:HECT-type E3 ubiquitin transferase n=1 Tax=Apophysomyces ossiformis TaxID=679940 RepID=A0A8H7BI26_9FUNG|nr:hypothetical protein EC973_001277 [Apophysomyces ossiformis]